MWPKNHLSRRTSTGNINLSVNFFHWYRTSGQALMSSPGVHVDHAILDSTALCNSCNLYTSESSGSGFIQWSGFNKIWTDYHNQVKLKKIHCGFKNNIIAKNGQFDHACKEITICVIQNSINIPLFRQFYQRGPFWYPILVQCIGSKDVYNNHFPGWLLPTIYTLYWNSRCTDHNL